MDDDNRNVVMEVDIISGVCNNSPIKSISFENEWR